MLLEDCDELIDHYQRLHNLELTWNDWIPHTILFKLRRYVPARPPDASYHARQSTACLHYKLAHNACCGHCTTINCK
jgi:hypothetical protein